MSRVPPFMMIVAVPPVAVPVKSVRPKALVVMAASPAVAELVNCRVPRPPRAPLTTNAGRVLELSRMPDPLTTSDAGAPELPVMLKVNPGALNDIEPICVGAPMLTVVLVAVLSNVALPVGAGTVFSCQLVPIFQSVVVAPDQVCARAGGAPNVATLAMSATVTRTAIV